MDIKKIREEYKEKFGYYPVVPHIMPPNKDFYDFFKEVEKCLQLNEEINYEVFCGKLVQGTII